MGEVQSHVEEADRKLYLQNMVEIACNNSAYSIIQCVDALDLLDFS